MIGRIVAQTALGLAPDLPLAPYSIERFATGRLLVGALRRQRRLVAWPTAIRHDRLARAVARDQLDFIARGGCGMSPIDPHCAAIVPPRPALALATGALAQDRVFFGIATGGTGGTYYPLGGMLAQLISNKVTIGGKKLSATAETAGASVANAQLLGPQGHRERVRRRRHPRRRVQAARASSTASR